MMESGAEGSGSPNCSRQDRAVPVAVVFGARTSEREHQFKLNRRARRSRGLRRRTLPRLQKAFFLFSAGILSLSFPCVSGAGELVILLNLPDLYSGAMAGWD